ncbi:MAG: spore germination protein [Clostridia bacterium]|nr:spore germination protein [Clostridia bacterium]
MLKEGKIGIQEAICLVTIAICNKIFFTTPGFFTRIVGNAGWYMTFISLASALMFFTFIYLLLKRFPGKNIVEVYDAALGRGIGFLFSFALMVSFLAASSFLTREFVDVMKVYVFPETPPSFLIGVMILAAAISAFLGLETIARTAKLGAYFALFGYFLVLLLSSQYFRFAHLFPILGYGLDKTVTTGIMRGSAYAEVVILAVFSGSLQGIKHIKKAGYISLLLSGFILSFGILCFTLIFGYTGTQEITAPMYIVARIIKYGSFFQRLEPLFLFLWIITTIIYVSILFYSTVSIYCKTFRLQDARPVILPMAVLTFTTAIFPKDFSSVVSQYVQGLRTYSNVTFYILPFIALIAAVLRKKKGEKL